MSGPWLPSAGRAVKVNHWPSAEYVADWPTRITPLMIGWGAAPAEGLGEPGGRLTGTVAAGLEGDGETDADVVGLELGGVFEGDGDGLEPLVDGVELEP